MRPKKKGERTMRQKLLTLKISEHLHTKWKVQAALEKTTMSEIAEKLIEDYLRRKGVK
jgi:vacuolar-type H+-ATPase subunit B/Vma2